MVFYEAEYLINRYCLNELKWHIPTSKEKAIFMLRQIFAILILIGGTVLQSHIPVVIGVLLFVFILLSYPWHLNRIVKRELEMAYELTGTYERKSIVSFLDESMKIQNADNGNVIELKYEHLNRFAETKNLYLLFTKTNIFVAITKSSIVEKTSEDFISFLKSKCDNIRWKLKRQ